MNIFFTSDTHYNHSNIVAGCTKWDVSKAGQSTRKFKTLEEHNNAIVTNINKVVGENDILYHLGDWSFGGINSIWEFRKQIKCKNVHLVLGNHDHHIENNKRLSNAWISKNGIVSTCDSTSDFDEQAYANDLFLSVNQLLIKKIGGYSMVLCHYAMRTWPKAHHGTIHLYGHSHGTLPDYAPFGTIVHKGTPDKLKYKSMDVGIDTHLEFRPYHIDEITKIMENRLPLSVDHHNENTN